MPRYLPKRRGLLWTLVAVVVLIVLAVIVIVLVPSVIIAGSTRSHIVSSPQAAPAATVVIVPGARVYADGTPSPMLVDRLDTAVELYKLGKVKKVLVSGNNGPGGNRQVDVMLQYCLDHGIPAQDVFTDYQGFDTYDTMYRARDVFQVKDALIATQDYHLPRAVYIARTLGIDATGVSANIQPYSQWVSAVREWPARVKAFFELHLTKPKPQDLGPVTPIDGDGQASRA
jgi:SanA protein